VALSTLSSGVVLRAGEDSTIDQNLGVVDLSDLDGELPLDAVSSTQILSRTENWEHPTWQNPDWPRGGGDSIGYPSIVKNVHGPGPDGKYYLFYAHHDPSSGIGVAVADAITGPYEKVRVPGRSDNQALPSFQYPAVQDSPDHSSSPCVVWNEDEERWFLYFHFYNHYWGRWRGPGDGHQMTALASCADLATHEWTILTDDSIDVAPPYVPVLPTTDSAWMRSQSSYHSIQRLLDGRWLAFLRGTPADGSATKLGFATSEDGRTWSYLPQNPVIHQSDGGGGRGGIYRPAFVGWLGAQDNGADEYLVAWSESPAAGDVPAVIYGRTTDFLHITRDPRGHVRWPAGDGQIGAWREGNRLYLFAGKHLHVLELPVTERVGPFRRGDCNDDDRIDISDAVCVVRGLFAGSPPRCRAAVDTNGEDGVDVSDAIYLLGYLFRHGPPLGDPFVVCRRSSAASDVAIGCQTPAICE